MAGDERVLGVLAGADSSLDWLARWARSADRIVAADGAADRLLTAGVPPHVAVGDFDSIVDRHTDFDRVHIENQDLSDCDKLVAYIAGLGVQAATFVGTEGDRPDHVLASLYSLSRAKFGVRIAYRTGFGWIVRPGDRLEIATPSQASISFMPLDICAGVTMSGVHWPLDNVDLRPVDRVSLSNRTIGATASISIREGVGLLYVERDAEPFWP